MQPETTISGDFLPVPAKPSRTSLKKWKRGKDRIAEVRAQAAMGRAGVTEDVDADADEMEADGDDDGGADDAVEDAADDDGGAGDDVEDAPDDEAPLDVDEDMEAGDSEPTAGGDAEDPADDFVDAFNAGEEEDEAVTAESEPAEDASAAELLSRQTFIFSATLQLRDVRKGRVIPKKKKSLGSLDTVGFLCI